jgi:hypothetical protein
VTTIKNKKGGIKYMNLKDTVKKRQQEQLQKRIGQEKLKQKALKHIHKYKVIFQENGERQRKVFDTYEEAVEFGKTKGPIIQPMRLKMGQDVQKHLTKLKPPKV